MLIACDLPRRNDLDGRGNLSEEALAGFAKFFLETCIDQVNFMEALVQPDRLRDRILIWTEEEIRADKLPPKAGTILEAILYRGELPEVKSPKCSAPARAMRGASPRPCSERGVLDLGKHPRPITSHLPRNARHAGCRACSRRNECSVTIHSILSSMQDSRSGMTRIY